MTKTEIARRLVELGDQRALSTLRGFSRERLESMLESYLPLTVEMPPIVDDGSPFTEADMRPEELLSPVGPALSDPLSETVIAPVSLLTVVEAKKDAEPAQTTPNDCGAILARPDGISRRPQTWAELIVAPFVFVYALLRV